MESENLENKELENAYSEIIEHLDTVTVIKAIREYAGNIKKGIKPLVNFEDEYYYKFNTYFNNYVSLIPNLHSKWIAINRIEQDILLFNEENTNTTSTDIDLPSMKVIKSELAIIDKFTVKETELLMNHYCLDSEEALQEGLVSLINRMFHMILYEIVIDELTKVERVLIGKTPPVQNEVPTKRKPKEKGAIALTNPEIALLFGILKSLNVFKLVHQKDIAKPLEELTGASAIYLEKNIKESHNIVDLKKQNVAKIIDLIEGKEGLLPRLKKIKELTKN